MWLSGSYKWINRPGKKATFPKSQKVASLPFESPSESKARQWTVTLVLPSCRNTPSTEGASTTKGFSPSLLTSTSSRSTADVHSREPNVLISCFIATSKLQYEELCWNITKSMMICRLKWLIFPFSIQRQIKLYYGLSEKKFGYLLLLKLCLKQVKELTALILRYP